MNIKIYSGRLKRFFGDKSSRQLIKYPVLKQKHSFGLCPDLRLVTLYPKQLTGRPRCRDLGLSRYLVNLFVTEMLGNYFCLLDSSVIKPHDTVILNAGTTTLLVFRKLPQNYNLSIVTNSISIALEAEGNPNFNVILVGGSVNSKYQFSYGSDAIEQIKKYHADKLILSVDGISAEHGFTTYYDKEAAIDVAMIEQSNCRIIAADHSKFGHSAFVKISDASVADYIVTNDQLSRELTEELNKQGVTILC